MKIGDLGIKKRTNEGVMDAVKQAATGVANKAAQFGMLGNDAKDASYKNREFELQKQNFIKLFQDRVDKVIKDGVVADPSKPAQTQQQTQQQPQTAAQTQQQTQQQPQGQAVDLDQLKAQSQAKQQQGQADQKQAIQQMDQTKQANAAAAQADSDLVAAVKAAKAKPAFQQTAADKAYIRQGASKGIHEQALDDYVWFNTLIEGVVDNSKFLAELANQPTPLNTWVRQFIKAQLSTYGQGVQAAEQKYGKTFDQLSNQFATEYAKGGQFPTKVAEQIFVYLKNAQHIIDNDGEEGTTTIDPLTGEPKQDQQANQQGQQGQTQDVNSVLSRQAGELASKDATRVATAVEEIIKASGFQPDAILKRITSASGSQSTTPSPDGTPSAPPVQ